MVERGGLDYGIRIRDEFSRSLSNFRAGIVDARRQFRQFQADVVAARGIGRSLREGARAARDLAGAQRDQARAARDAQRPLTENERTLRRIALEARRQRALERESVRLRSAQAADARRQASEAQRLARARAQVARLEQRALTDQQRAVQALARAERDRERTSSAISRRQQRDAQLRLAALAEQQRRAEALAVQQLRAQRREVSAREARDPFLVAQRRLNRELFAEAVTRRQIDILRGRARAQILTGDILGGQQTILRARQLEDSLRRSAREGNRLLFTFRRLVGVLAIFTLAREGVNIFNQLIRSGLTFIDTVARSTIGVAGLSSTLADVRNELGESVGHAEELGLARGLAREQVF
jgi:hypothetical protein